MSITIKASYINIPTSGTRVKMNAYEDSALEHFDDEVQNGNLGARPDIFHPYLYTSSGVDAMGILLQMYSRPNPQVDTGPVDNDCPLILCDLAQPDKPIIYASDAFAILTGYSCAEILGRNCRFLQCPPGQRAPPNRSRADKAALRSMRHAVRHNRECVVEIANYRKDGTKFLNHLTIIPVRWNSPEFNYSVGLQQVVRPLPLP